MSEEDVKALIGKKVIFPVLCNNGLERVTGTVKDYRKIRDDYFVVDFNEFEATIGASICSII